MHLVSPNGSSRRERPGRAQRAGPVHRWVESAFAIDPRSLGVFRIALGAVLLAILASYTSVHGDLLSPRGPFPLSVIRQALPARARLFFLPYELAPGIAGWLLLTLLWGVGILLVLGLYTRFACVGAWLGLCSLQLRSLFVQDYGDQLLVRLLFWSMFLPLGARFSLDARLGRVRRQDAPVLSAASAGLLLQVAAVYLLAGLAKNGPEWRDGTAVFYVMSQSYWATPRSAWLLGQPELMRSLTALTPRLEIALAVLLFAPLALASARVLAIGAIVGFHLSLAAFITLGAAPFVSIAAALVFLPGSLWSRMLPLRTESPAQAHRVSSAGEERVWRRLGRLVPVAPLAILVLNVAAPIYRGRPAADPPPVAGIWQAAVVTLHLTQSWTMYAPGVDRVDGWLGAVGVLASGREVDVLREGEAPSLVPPARLPWAGDSLRWGLFRESVINYREQLTPGYLGWLCRRWNRSHAGQERLVDLRLDWVRIDRARDPAGREPQRHTLGRRTCPTAGAPPGRVRPSAAEG
jgi:hypothetical protein